MVLRFSTAEALAIAFSFVPAFAFDLAPAFFGATAKSSASLVRN
jgi:hypothetical protein